MANDNERGDGWRCRLDGCRSRIDEIDRQLVALLSRRAIVVEEVAALKKEIDMAVHQPQREADVYANISDANDGPLPNDAVHRIFERVIEEMRRMESAKMSVL